MKNQDVKNDYISAYVHEMNNIAANISGAVDILLENKITDPEIVSKYLKIVSASVGDLKTQIQNLLTLNKISDYQEELLVKKFDLNEKSEKLTESFLAVADKKKIKLKFKTSIQDTVTVDGDKIMVVIRNLLSNALKFTKKGEVKLELSSTAEGIEICVSDTGCGMDEDKIESLFDCYAQGENKKEGFGIGLYISKHFVKMHGGIIDVKSKKGEGSVFKVVLPA